MTGRLIQRNDQFFKRLLDQPGAAGVFLRERLPPDLTAKLSDDPPELLPDSFVSDALAEQRSDRLYLVRTREARPLLIHVLIEHKSAPDPDVALQLFLYQARIFERWRRRAADGPPPAVVSLVVYHGAAPWRTPLSFADYLTDDPDLRRHLVDFRYRLVDLGHIPDAALSRDRGLRVGLLALKYVGRDGPSRALLLSLARVAWGLGSDDLSLAFRYILGEPNDVTEALVRDVLRAVAPEQEEPMMSIMLEEYKARWLSEGRAAGHLEGKLEGHLGLLTKMATLRFGALPEAAQRRLAAASSEELERLALRILDAPTLEAWLS